MDLKATRIKQVADQRRGRRSEKKPTQSNTQASKKKSIGTRSSAVERIPSPCPPKPGRKNCTSQPSTPRSMSMPMPMRSGGSWRTRCRSPRLLRLPVVFFLLIVDSRHFLPELRAEEGVVESPPHGGGDSSSDYLPDPEGGPRIAIIGGAVTGALTSKYLADYDVSCHLATLSVFEALPIQAPVDIIRPSSSSWNKDDESLVLVGQGTRVRTARLSDAHGILVEAGASIGFRDFHLILDLIRNDPDFLQIGPPFNIGPEAQAVGDDPLRQGLGVYRGGADEGGRQRNPWSLNTAHVPTGVVVAQWLLPTWATSAWTKACLVWRYGWELRHVSKLTSHVLQRFAQLPSLLDNVNDPTTYYDSPLDVWKAVQLDSLVHTSFDAVLDAIGVPSDLPVWRQWLGHGSIREELLTAINLVNYNQNNANVNGIVGLGSYAASTGGLFSIQGGNVKLIASAFRQANKARETHCHPSHSAKSDRSRILEVAKRVTTVVAATSADPVTFELFSGAESLGKYDIVVLAAPFPHARIDFFVQSVMDASVLQPMPLGQHSVIDPEHPPPSFDASHEGHDPFPPPGLDPATSRPYTPVVTTVVSRANLTLLPPEQLPRSILMTVQGKQSLYNITAITQLHAREGVYKIFSDAPLPSEALMHLFGPHYWVEFVKAWTGPHGGATPDYRGTTTHEHFILYDGAPRGTDSVAGSQLGVGGALYYPNAMEQSGLACMELAAIGAKAVAKLIARRLGLIHPESLESREVRDEL